MTSADLNQDGHGDLVMGAPGYSCPGHIHVGRVYLIYGSDLGLPLVDLDLDKEAHGIDLDSPSAVPGPAASVSPGNWLKVQSVKTHPRPPESDCVF